MSSVRIYERSGGHCGSQDVTGFVAGKRGRTSKGKVLVHNGRKVKQPTKRNRTLQKILGGR